MTCKLKLQNKGLSYRQMYRKFKKVVLGLLPHLMPLIFFSTILRSEALVDNSYFFQNSCFRKLFDIRFSYKHCNFSHICLLVKMAFKTVTRSIVVLKTCQPEIIFTSNSVTLFYRAVIQFCRNIFQIISHIYQKVPATVDGMLGGYARISPTDIRDSKKFLKPFLEVLILLCVKYPCHKYYASCN